MIRGSLHITVGGATRGTSCESHHLFVQLVGVVQSISVMVS